MFSFRIVLLVVAAPLVRMAVASPIPEYAAIDSLPLVPVERRAADIYTIRVLYRRTTHDEAAEAQRKSYNINTLAGQDRLAISKESSNSLATQRKARKQAKKHAKRAEKASKLIDQHLLDPANAPDPDTSKKHAESSSRAAYKSWKDSQKYPPHVG